MASRGGRRARSGKQGGPDGVVPDELLEGLVAAGVPPELLEAIAGASEFGEFLDGVLGSGALPPPEEAFEAVLGGFAPLTEPDCDPADRGAGRVRAPRPLRVVGDGSDLPAVLHSMIESAEQAGSPEALAMTRVLGVIGPDAVRAFRDAARATIAAVAPRAGDRLRYTYDFGDDWQHEIVVEQVAAADPAATYPRCLGGRRAAVTRRLRWFDRAAIDAALLAVIDRPDLTIKG